LVPQRRFAFCFATNSLGGRMAVPQVTREVLAEFLEGDEPELAWSDLDSARVVEYCWRYSAALDDLEISFQDGLLKMRSFPKGGFPTQTTPPGPALPPFQIGFIGPDRIALVDPPLKETQERILAPSRRLDRMAPVGISNSSTYLGNELLFLKVGAEAEAYKES
jgi:hypothetical protein